MKPVVRKLISNSTIWKSDDLMNTEVVGVCFAGDHVLVFDLDDKRSHLQVATRSGLIGWIGRGLLLEEVERVCWSAKVEV